MRNHNIGALFLAGLICCLSLYSGAAFSHHLVPRHDLICSDDFSCPQQLYRRIDFWIQVFKEWGKEKAIFHDPGHPQRVYSVIETGSGCGRGASKKIKKEKKRLKSALYNAAAKIESGSGMTEEELHLSALFQGSSPDRIRRAGQKIRCQSGVRDSYIEGLKRFQRYQYMVDTILAQHDLPEDIRYLPFVESSYNPAAYSKAGAAGMWQIMPKTARVLGLDLDAAIDERLDPEAATHAAARYLVKSKNSLTALAKSLEPGIKDEEVSPFIITSYNYGLNGMRRAIKEIGPDYMEVLEKYKSPSFQVAVQNFYSSFLAARHVTLNAQSYFGKILPEKFAGHQTVILDHDTSIERIKSVFNVTEEDLKPLNLGLTRFIWHGWRLVPSGYQLKLPYKEDSYGNEISRLKKLPPETAAAGPGDYAVRKGDTACGIARALKVNCRELIAVNRLGRKALIRIGQKLVIPGKLAVVASTAGRGPEQKVVPQSEAGGSQPAYRVKKGDTACAIAERYNVKCKTLISANNLGRRATIVIGQTLIIPGGRSASAGVVALDENNRYTVRKGDFACSIAARFSVSCTELRQINNLNRKAVIHPGQKLKIPGLVLPDTSETAKRLANVDVLVAEAGETVIENSADRVIEDDSIKNLLDTLPDLSISVTGSADRPVYRIWVEADETLGHYSDWLGLSSTKTIRALNNIHSASDLRIGQLLELPIKSDDVPADFEKKRMEYHQVLSESLKTHYNLTGVVKHRVRSGESVWLLSNESGFPIWLLYRLNPDLKFKPLHPGQNILLPKLQEESK